MKLSETNELIKGDLLKIASGGYDEYFEKENVYKVLELSFFLNHIETLDDSIIFSYEKIKIKVANISELAYFSVYTSANPESQIYSVFKNQEDFKKAFKSFLINLRDDKLNKLLNDE